MSAPLILPSTAIAPTRPLGFDGVLPAALGLAALPASMSVHSSFENFYPAFKVDLLYPLGLHRRVR